MKRFEIGAITFSFILLFSITSNTIYAESSSDSVNVSEWTTYSGESILTDPTAQTILKSIEISKRILAELQNPQQPQLTEHQKFIEEQRKIAQAQLQEELDRIDKRHADKAPRAAFAKYVSKFPERYHDYLWELFDYMYSKVIVAREHRDNVLANGGSASDAQQVFVQYAAISKAERIEFASEMILKHELVNKISNIDDFNALPTNTKQHFVTYMNSIGLGKYAMNPMYDSDPLSGMSSQVDTQKTILQQSEIVTIDYSQQSDGLEQIFVINNDENNIVELTHEEPVSQTVKQFNGYNYGTQSAKLMNDVSEFTLSAWVKPDYSSGSAEFTILSKENAFKLTINNINTPEKVAKFSIFDGFKWTIIHSYSTIKEDWTHIAAKLDGQTISLYINGNLETTKQIEGIPTLNSYGFFEPGPIE